MILDKRAKGISEILAAADELRTRKEKINYLREHSSNALVDILRGAFDPSIKWLLPEGEPPYTPSETPDLENVLYRESKRLYLFVEGGHPNLKQTQREIMFIQMLSNLAPADAKLLCAVKDKKFPYASINKKLVQEAFPDLIKG